MAHNAFSTIFNRWEALNACCYYHYYLEPFESLDIHITSRSLGLQKIDWVSFSLVFAFGERNKCSPIHVHRTFCSDFLAPLLSPLQTFNNAQSPYSATPSFIYYYWASNMFQVLGLVRWWSSLIILVKLLGKWRR